ncbi:pirin family protein [uncultured Neptuniibacter sp.]|uniref:pirin family protein n=1 Tax=uncultured Neptuniibacter sp. TaxID=502143 RepID=UPI0026249533|nr:pirin family protein [uncultured Neptuniibacter sp.]
MSARTVLRVIPGVDSEDGAGVKLKRSMGRNPASRVDPFLMLDAFSSANPDDYLAGFPPHPHRGFETVTYMLNGHMIHRDHMGNEGELRAGGVQWMTAGRGVIHEERPQKVNGLMRGFQLWVNLPAHDKMKPAAYQNIDPEEVPQFDLNEGASIRLVAGRLSLDEAQIVGPIQAEATDPLYIDLILQAWSEVTLPVMPDYHAVIYLFEGAAMIAGEQLQRDAATQLTEGESITLRTEGESARMLILAGKPLNEAVAQYGPFVMNTMEEVEQALADYRDGTLTR